MLTEASLPDVDQQGGLLTRLPLYLGGFMGPFGTVIMVPMVPELRAHFEASTARVALGYSLYLVPFALMLLVSGTLGERWGRRRTVRGTYLLYAVASLACVVAPTLGWFVAGRALQGVANAFITPLLVAGLAEMVPADRLGREVGIYSSFQAVGGGLGPIVGGFAADTDWRLAFWAAALISAALSIKPPPGEPRRGATGVPIRPLLTPRMILLGVAFMFAAAGPIGAGVLVGVAARDVLLMSGTAAGVVLFLGSMAAMLAGPLWGRLLDTYGARSLGTAAAAASTLLVAALAIGRTPVVLGVLWVVAAAAISAVVVVFQSVGSSVLPDNRGGALSFLLGFRFIGHAVGPLLFLPLIDTSAGPAFVISAVLGLVTVGVVATVSMQPAS